jgi:hypothetical protein
VVAAMLEVEHAGIPEGHEVLEEDPFEERTRREYTRVEVVVRLAGWTRNVAGPEPAAK